MRSALVLLSLCSLGALQARGQAAESQLSQGKEIFRNQRVTIRLLEIAAHAGSSKVPLPHDTLIVFVNKGRTQSKLLTGKLLASKVAAGEVRYREAASPLGIQNEGDAPLRLMTIEFADPQGKLEHTGTSSHTCDPGSTTACFDEHGLFCTAKVCVEDVVIAPATVTHKHSHATDHMLVAISDYELTDQIEGKGIVVRTRKSGEIEYISLAFSVSTTSSSDSNALS